MSIADYDPLDIAAMAHDAKTNPNNPFYEAPWEDWEITDFTKMYGFLSWELEKKLDAMYHLAVGIDEDKAPDYSLTDSIIEWVITRKNDHLQGVAKMLRDEIREELEQILQDKNRELWELCNVED